MAELEIQLTGESGLPFHQHQMFLDHLSVTESQFQAVAPSVTPAHLNFQVSVPHLNIKSLKKIKNFKNLRTKKSHQINVSLP